MQDIQDSNICVGAKVSRIDDKRLYETGVYTTINDSRQTVVFWTPELQCIKKDETHLSLLLPQTDECEDFYNTLEYLNKSVTDEACLKWNQWFEKDELSVEDVQERFISCIKAGSKEEQGRVMNVKMSPKIKFKVNGVDNLVDDCTGLFDKKTKRVTGRVLIELKRVVIGRGNFKNEFVVHQVFVNTPEVEEPVTSTFISEDWVNFE